MTGGPVWDFLGVEGLLDNLSFVWRHQTTTNEAIPHQLPAVLDSLNKWVSESPNQFTGKDVPNVKEVVTMKVEKLQALRCSCQGVCKAPQCLCRENHRVCTTWCGHAGRTCHQESKSWTNRV